MTAASLLSLIFGCNPCWSFSFHFSLLPFLTVVVVVAIFAATVVATFVGVVAATVVVSTFVAAAVVFYVRVHSLSQAFSHFCLYVA